MRFGEKSDNKTAVAGLFIIAVALFLSACSSSAFGPKLKLKYSYKTFPMDVANGEMKTTANGNYSAKYEFTLTNYELKSDADLMKTLSDSKEIRVYFYLHGQKNTTKDSPLKSGIYPIGTMREAAGSFVDFAFFVVEEGKQTAILSQESAAVDKSGQVKITSVTDDTVKGEIDVSTKKGYSVSGRFTAKIKK